MQIFKKIKPISFLLVACAINMLLSFVLEYTNGASKTMWKQYYEEEQIDFVFVGASVSSASFNPKIFNERLGVQSFNMGTPAQHMEQSIMALEVAFEEHDIETVVFGMGFFSLQTKGNEDAELTFVKALARQQGGIKGIRTAWNYLLSMDVRDTEKSVKYFFPWVYNGVDVSIDAIVKNIEDKCRPFEEKLDVNSDEPRTWCLEKGYRPYTGALDYSSMQTENSNKYYYQYFDHESIYYFEQLVKLCKENEVELIVINTPHPVEDVVSCFWTYGMNDSEMKALCKENGVDYYDFSLAKPELFNANADYYYNFEHLNYKGANVFSNAVCDLLEARKNGEAVNDVFWNMEEYWEQNSEIVDEWISY